MSGMTSPAAVGALFVEPLMTSMSTDKPEIGTKGQGV